MSKIILCFITNVIELIINYIDLTLYLISILSLFSSILFAFLPDPYYTRGWLFLTYLGSSTAYIAYGLVIYYLGDSMNAYKIIITLIAGGWINLSLKNIFKMPRPTNPKINISGYSFPSGHAESSTTFWSSVYLLYPRNAVLLSSIILSIVISVSRVALNVHYPRDIIFGGLVGILTALSFIYMLNRFRNKSMYIILHITLSIIMIFTYYLYNDLMLLKFSGFLLGSISHPLLYFRYGEPTEARIRQIVKFISSFLLVIILYLFSHGAGIAFISFFLIGIVIPVIKFII